MRVNVLGAVSHVVQPFTTLSSDVRISGRLPTRFAARLSVADGALSSSFTGAPLPASLSIQHRTSEGRPGPTSCMLTVHLAASGARTFSGCSRSVWWCFLRRTAQRTSAASSARMLGVARASHEAARPIDGGSTTTEKKPIRTFRWPDQTRPRVCILGGGFGGLFTALKLESLIWAPELRPQVVLVDQSDRFVFKPLLYELLTREVDMWEIAPRFTDLLAGTAVQFVKDTVAHVRPSDLPPGGSSREGGRIQLNSGLEIPYDWLVLALGAETKMSGVPGAQQLSYPFATLDDALTVGDRLTELERERFAPSSPPIRVAIVGSGYAGIELASTVAQRLGPKGQIQVVDPNPEICPSGTKGNRDAAAKILAARNVELKLGFLVKSLQEDTSPGSSKSSPATIQLALERRVAAANAPAVTPEISPVDLVLWTVGTRAALPDGSTSFPLNGRGQAETERTLKVKGQPRVFALGDSAAAVDASGAPLAATAQVAFQQADYVGWNLWAAINDRPLLPFRYTHLGEMMTLGTREAAVSVGFVEGLTFDGQLAHTARKLAYLARLPTNEHKIKVGASWLAKSVTDALAAFQSSWEAAAAPKP